MNMRPFEHLAEANQNPPPIPAAGADPRGRSSKPATAPRIMVVEDEASLALLLAYNLEAEGYDVECVESGEDALARVDKTPFSLAILDIMLPDSDGLDICKGIRARSDFANLPIIFLTARASEADRIVGLELGANDYIVKPFFVRELIARIKVHFRGPGTNGQQVLKSAGLELDAIRRTVHRDGTPVALTATEFKLLEHLMARPGVVFSRDQLLDAVWGHDRAVTDRTVDVYVLRLRQKIEDEQGPEFIRSVRGFGYSFRAETPVAA